MKKKTFPLLSGLVETDYSKNIDSFGDDLWAALSSWFTSDKIGTSMLQFFIIKPLHEQIFEWIHFINIKFFRKKYENQFKTTYFTGKMKIILWEQEKCYLFGKFWGCLSLTRSHMKNILIKNMVHTCVLQES